MIPNFTTVHSISTCLSSASSVAEDNTICPTSLQSTTQRDIYNVNF